ncbi:3-oxoadipate enol-lactonase/4-carboxymuconolactone decarboxylase [Actinokineospora auranticolor]|uniref:3-oxoadipate enol-lactonase/4-carboxymuconolactone decarboxylase n=2 Tax=Actinokineospora auranticolor TaxID=155976 RepID=A0A2S6GME4_9PSEU|nr:3-oxoadipate enol-lactonase/4-carboxymuconolactone decarboxylase [Actinokineospora auranticolor]
MIVNHEVRGRGPVAVVLAGSVGTDLSLWDAQVDPLVDAGYRVIRYDHRGHGSSPVPPGPYRLADIAGDVLALLDHLGVRTASVVGVSLGGMVGMWLGTHAPERVQNLVLCCTSADLGPSANWQTRADLVRAEGMASVVDQTMGRWVTAGYGDDSALREMLLRVPAEGYAGCCEAIGSMDLVGGLGRIAAPTLVVSGAQDPATPPEQGARIAAAIPGARQAVVQGAAHLGVLEKPEEFTRLILSGLPPATGDAMRRSVLGDVHVDRTRVTEFNRPFQEYITDSVWGSVWTRPGLDRRTRSAITLAVLTSLRAHDELTMHVRAALRHGLSREEIAEVLLHTGAYVGVPAANAAFAAAQRVFDEDDA